jgi:hypothetical protein
MPRPNRRSADGFEVRDLRRERAFGVGLLVRPLRAGTAFSKELLLLLPADRGSASRVPSPELRRGRGGEDARVAML